MKALRVEGREGSSTLMVNGRDGRVDKIMQSWLWRFERLQKLCKASRVQATQVNLIM